MINRNKFLKTILLTIMFYLCIIVGVKVKAAQLAIGVSKSTADVNETITITITSEYTGRINLSASGGTLSASNVWVEGNSQTVTLTSSTAGTITITATPEPDNLSDSNGTDVSRSVEAQGAKVTFNDTAEIVPPPQEETPPAKSNNANLGNLGIRPNDFTGFKPGTTSYNVTVPNDVDKVEVYAVAKDSKSTITGTGNQNLNVGANALKVVVTAEDGTTKTYTINVTRQTKEETENTTTTNEVANETSNEATNSTIEGTAVDYSEYDLQELEVEGYTLSPKFSPDVYEYKINVTSKDVTELNIKTKGKNEKVKIEIVGNTNLQEGENIITILVTNEVTGDNATYQIIANKTEKIDLEEANAAIDANIAKANKVRMIILGIGLFIIAAAVVFIIVRHKMKKNLEDEYEKYEYDDEDDEDDNYDVEDEEEQYDEETPKALQKKKTINIDSKDQLGQIKRPEKRSIKEDEEDRYGGRGKHF